MGPFIACFLMGAAHTGLIKQYLLLLHLVLQRKKNITKRKQTKKQSYKGMCREDHKNCNLEVLPLTILSTELTPEKWKSSRKNKLTDKVVP